VARTTDSAATETAHRTTAESTTRKPTDAAFCSAERTTLVGSTGKCARAEQERLERDTGLENGRTPKRDPRGYFP
jgi:hypothetical protein